MLNNRNTKKKHKNTIFKAIAEMRQELITETLKAEREGRDINVKLLAHRAGLIRKYSRYMKILSL